MKTRANVAIHFVRHDAGYVMTERPRRNEAEMFEGLGDVFVPFAMVRWLEADVLLARGRE